MKWINLGTRTFLQANACKKWFDENGIRTGEIFDCYGIWKVPYMPIDSKQKEICNNQIEYWINNDMI